MVDCMECTNFIKCHYSGQLTGRLTSCPDFKQKPQTNADRIRAMSDEELTKAIGKYMYCGLCPLRSKCSTDEFHPCSEVVMEWLKQPAEE